MMFGFGQKNIGQRFLDDKLLDLGGLPFTGKMATEGVLCCAELGWGKTWLVFLRYLEAYVRMGIGGWCLGAKSEDLSTVVRLFRKLRAERRLTIISPKLGNRINWFEALASIAPPGSKREEIVGGLTSLNEVEQRSANKSSDDQAQFFKSHGQQVLSAIITCLLLAGESVTARNMYRFLVSLPTTGAQLADAGWQEQSYANQIVKRAYNAPKSPREDADCETAILYLFRELANLHERTRTSITSTVSAMMGKLTHGWLSEVWSSTTNVRFQDAFDGRFFYIDTSPLEYSEYGVYSLVMAKHLAQRMIQRRHIDAYSRPVALFGDEWQAHFVTSDRDHQAVTRSKLGCTWAATQNLTGLFSVLGGGPAAEAQTKSWIALLGTKIWGAQTDWASCTYASEMCGVELETFLSGNINHGATTTAWDGLFGNVNASTGWSENYQPVVRPEHFVRLRKPEPPRYEAGAIVVTPRLRPLVGRHWAEVVLRPLGKG